MNLVCGMLNMPQAMQQKCYESILRRIEIASETVAQESMKNAANELKDGSSDVKDVKCMFDGTWQRRGFSSLVGAVSCLSTDSGKAKFVKPCKSLTLQQKTFNALELNIIVKRTIQAHQQQWK